MIYSYSHKPTPVFSATNSDNENSLTFGVECEVDYSDNVVTTCSPYDLSDRLDAITHLMYCKSDGSLGNGVEIVSHPCTLKYHMNAMRWKYLLQTCVKAGYRSHDSHRQTCGLHIHVGRKQLDNDNADVIRRIIVLTERYWDKLYVFSRRSRSQLNQWSPRPECCHSWYDHTLSGEAVSALAETYIRTHDTYHDRRYTAVNVTNDATIEFRIFRGTLKRDTLIAALQLVSNICRYALTHTWEDVQASTWEDVALYEQYNELNAYLLKRGLVPETAVPSTPYHSRRTPDFIGADGIPA